MKCFLLLWPNMPTLHVQTEEFRYMTQQQPDLGFLVYTAYKPCKATMVAPIDLMGWVSVCPSNPADWH